MDIATPAESEVRPRGDEAARVLNVSAGIVLLAWAGILADFGPVVSRILDNVHWTVAYTGAAWLGWIGVRRAERPDERETRRWFALGLSAYAVGQLLWVAQVIADWTPFPGPTDLGCGALGPASVWALWTALRAHGKSGRARAAALDAAMLATTALVVILAVYLPLRGDLRWPAMVVLIAYPAGFFAAAGVALVLALTFRLGLERRWLAVFAALFLSGSLWMQWNALLLRGAQGDGSLLNFLFSPCALALGWAALRWEARPVENADRDRLYEAILRILPLAAVVGAATALVLVLVLPGFSETLRVVVGLGAIVVVGLATARQTLLISERERLLEAERQARESEARFKALFDHAPDGVLIFENDFVVEANDGARRLFGGEAGDLIGLAPVDLLAGGPEETGHAARALEERVAAARAGRTQHFECRARTVEGTPFEAEVGLGRIETGERVLLQAWVRDISARKRAERTLIDLNTQLERRVEARTEELRAKNRELETFTYSVSHDLKAPLRGIDGYSRLLLEDHAESLDDEGRRFLGSVRQASLHMGQLIDDLLAYSQIERRAPAVAPVRPRAVARGILATLKPEIERRGLRVRLEIPEELTVRADAQGLTIALRNLIDNAMKFTRDAAEPEIEIGGRAAGGEGLLWVRDNGIGFDMRFVGRIFDIFQRLHRTEDYPGTGVGLAIVRKAMERAGGRTWAESTPGRGATFHLQLPLSE